MSENYSDLTKFRSTDIEILLIDVTFYLYHVQKLVLNVLKEIKKTNRFSGERVNEGKYYKKCLSCLYSRHVINKKKSAMKMKCAIITRSQTMYTSLTRHRYKK